YFPTLARLAPGERHQPIAAVLRTFGWRTAAFYPPAVFFVDAAKLKAYADSNFDFEYVKFEYIAAPRPVDHILHHYDPVEPQESVGRGALLGAARALRDAPGVPVRRRRHRSLRQRDRVHRLRHRPAARVPAQEPPRHRGGAGRRSRRGVRRAWRPLPRLHA